MDGSANFEYLLALPSGFSLSQTRRICKNYLHAHSSYGYAQRTAASDFDRRAQAQGGSYGTERQAFHGRGGYR